MSDRQLPLKRRGLGDLLAEELRRLDADQPYADALSAATGEQDLDARPAMREHVWRDPMRGRPRKPAGTKKPTAKKAAKKPHEGDDEGRHQEDGGDTQGGREEDAPRRRSRPQGRRPPRRRSLVSTPTVLVHRDPAELAAAVAARLITRLVDVQSARGEASLVLTGGSIAAIDPGGGGRVARPATRSTGRGWTSGGATSGSCPPATRSATRPQAREALLDAVPLDPARVHPMPASDGPDGDDPDAAAARYADELRRGAPGPRTTARRRPSTSACSASGPDGHIASLFPEHPALYDDRPVLAVRNSPKPPPTRISLELRR